MKINPWLAICMAPAFVACTDEPVNEPPVNTTYSNGILVSNEGPFQGGNGTLSFYDSQTGVTSNDVFSNVNGRPLGNIVHSLHRGMGSNLYVVVNNSGVVEVVSAEYMTSVGTITGLQQPRYAQEISSNKLAISDWGTGSVEFYDPASQTALGSVVVGSGPERLLLDGNNLYVANSGGFGLDSTVVIIDATTMMALDTLYVGYNPNSMAMDSNGDLWVLCGGYTDWNDQSNNLDASLVQIDVANSSVVNSFDFDPVDRPTAMKIDAAQNTLYYLDNGYQGKPFSMSITANSLPTDPIISSSYQIYSLGIDIQNGELYFGDAVDYASNGKVYRYSIQNDQVTDTIEVGIIPGNFEVN